MIIGVMGFAHSGKNTVAKTLKLRGPEHRELFTEIAFADELKRIVMGLFDFTEEQCWGILKEVPDRRYPREHTWVPNPMADSLGCACCRKTVWDEGPCYLTPRYAQQLIGTEGARACYKPIWAKRALADAKSVGMGAFSYHRVSGTAHSPSTPPLNTVFPDVRFVDEYESIKAEGGRVFRVKRKGIESPPYDHPSETEQLQIPDDKLDGVINNDGDLEHLEREVFRVIGWKTL